MPLFDRVVGLRSQLLFFCITIVLITILSVVRWNDFFAREKSPLVLPLTPEKLKEWGAQPSAVTVGLYLLDFPSFKMEANEFVFDGIVWFEYNPAHVATETIAKFSFEKGEIVKKSAPDSKLLGNKMLTLFKVRVKFSSNVDYTEFPFDDHRIYISLLNTFVNPSDVMFFSDVHNFIFSKDIYFVEWDYVDNYVQYGYEKIALEEFAEEKTVRNPKVVFAFDVERAGARQVLLILIPLFLIFFISLFSFGFMPEINKNQIGSVAAGGIASLIAYRFVLQNLSPRVGYFMIADYLFTILLVFAFIILFMGLYVLHKNGVSRFTQMLRAALFLAFHISLNSLWYYLLFVWER